MRRPNPQRQATVRNCRVLNNSYPLHHFAFHSQGQALQMGYMDVAPTDTANGHTAVLLHGKNFCAATWGDSIKVLSEAGYRVVAPDQIGFCPPHVAQRGRGNAHLPAVYSVQLDHHPHLTGFSWFRATAGFPVARRTAATGQKQPVGAVVRHRRFSFRGRAAFAADFYRRSRARCLRSEQGGIK